MLICSAGQSLLNSSRQRESFLMLVAVSERPSRKSGDGAGDTTRWLRALDTVPEDHVQIAAPTLDGPWLPVISAWRGSDSDFSLYRHAHIYGGHSYT